MKQPIQHNGLASAHVDPSDNLCDISLVNVTENLTKPHDEKQYRGLYVHMHADVIFYVLNDDRTVIHQAPTVALAESWIDSFWEEECRSAAAPQPADKEAQYQRTVSIQCQLNDRSPAIAKGLNSAGFTTDRTIGAFVKGEVRVYHSLGQPEIQRRLEMLMPYSRFSVKTINTAAIDIDDVLECTPEQTLDKILLTVDQATSNSPIAVQWVQVQELCDKALDWAVAKALGCSLESSHYAFRRIAQSSWSEEKIAEQLAKMKNEIVTINPFNGNSEPIPSYSASPNLAVPIMERERISTCAPEQQQTKWFARKAGDSTTWLKFGPAMLIAGMRCFVASKLGEQVAVPIELLA